MKPGRELDKLVAQTMGTYQITTQEDIDNFTSGWSSLGDEYYEEYSTDIEAAMEAFEWLEQHHPWGQNIFLCLCRGGVRREHQSVRINQTGEWEEIIAYREIIGDSYPHAICKAILLAKVETGF